MNQENKEPMTRISSFPAGSIMSVIRVATLGALITLAACSTSGKSGQKAVVDEATIQVASLAQRPSENIHDAKGKITRTGEIYLLRGLANVFSRGMDTLGVKMVRQGLDARVFNHGAWRELADNIIARDKRKQVSYPVVIMGHSLGANAAANMAKYLGDRGVRVSYVVAFDPTVTTTVGKNVDRVINFYLPNDRNSNVIKRAPGFRGNLQNINVRGVRGVTHTTLEKDSKFHSDVISRTLSFTKSRRRS